MGPNAMNKPNAMRKIVVLASFVGLLAAGVGTAIVPNLLLGITIGYVVGVAVWFSAMLRLAATRSDAAAARPGTADRR